MKKYIMVTLLSLLLFLVQVKDVSADMGPKPSITITIIGIDEPYSFELLSLERYPDAEVLDEEMLIDETEYSYYLDTYPSVLNGYIDNDDFTPFVLYSLAGGIKRTANTSTSQTFAIDYMPPDTFKIVLVTEDDKLIVSEIINRLAFNTVIEYDLNGVDTSTNQDRVGVVTGNLSSAKITFDTILRTILRVIYTILIEIGVFYFFKYRKKDSYKIVVLTNATTQLILSYIVIYTAITNGLFQALIYLILLEVIIFFVEALIYSIFLKEHTKVRAFSYAFVANFASLIVGIFLINYI